MKNIKLTLVLTAFFIVACLMEVSAQRNAQKTSGGMAAYGVAPKQAKYKSKKVKKVRKKVPKKAPKVKEAKAPRRKGPAYRKKNNWAS